MRILLLISLLYTLILANQTQIVLGSFLDEANAIRHVKHVNDFINKDVDFKTFFENNSLINTHKKDGKYFSVVIKPFNSASVEQKVLKYLKTEFKGAYILKLLTVKKEITKVKKIEVPKKIKLPKKVIQKPVISSVPIKKNLIVEDKNKSKILIKKSVTPQNKESSAVNKLYLLGIIIVLLILYFIRKKLQKREDPALRTIIIDTPPQVEEILNSHTTHKPSLTKNTETDISDITLEKNTSKN